MENFKDEQVLRFITNYENSSIEDIKSMINGSDGKQFLEKVIILMKQYTTLKAYCENLENKLNNILNNK